MESRIDFRSEKNLHCHKCALLVHPSNDATLLDYFLLKKEEPLRAGIIKHAQSRHLLPVMEGGRVVCEGSPSRAQYLEGQPRDGRNVYPFSPDRVGDFRQAYAELLQHTVETQLS